MPTTLEKSIDNDIEGLPGLAVQSWTTTLGMTGEDAKKQLEQMKWSYGSLRERMMLAARLMNSLLASWIIFLDHDWATDTYTGSFSGRNYNSGPRDSNEWGAFTRASEGSSRGSMLARALCVATSTSSNIAETLGSFGELYKSLGLLDYDNMLAEDELEKVSGNTLWNTSAIHQQAFKITGFMRTTRVELTRRLTEARASNDPMDNVKFVADFRSWLKSTAPTELPAFKALFS